MARSRSTGASSTSIRVQEEVFDYIEQVTQTMLRDQKEEKEGTKIADL